MICVLSILLDLSFLMIHFDTMSETMLSDIFERLYQRVPMLVPMIISSISDEMNLSYFSNIAKDDERSSKNLYLLYTSISRIIPMYLSISEVKTRYILRCIPLLI